RGKTSNADPVVIALPKRIRSGVEKKLNNPLNWRPTKRTHNFRGIAHNATVHMVLRNSEKLSWTKKSNLSW
ncbi:hypothetical protein N8628_05465, partial [Verrucomicrobia bacterium]|nr:hypothetical protein [Verrucomicrobiota bacterium]